MPRTNRSSADPSADGPAESTRHDEPLDTGHSPALRIIALLIVAVFVLATVVAALA